MEDDFRCMSCPMRCPRTRADLLCRFPEIPLYMVNSQENYERLMELGDSLEEIAARLRSDPELRKELASYKPPTLASHQKVCGVCQEGIRCRVADALALQVEDDE